MSESLEQTTCSSNDPRPDIKEDSQIWEALLAIARFEKDGVRETLKGFRSGGCRLKIGDKKTGLIFNFGDEAGDAEKEIIKKYATKYKAEIQSLFRRVYVGIIKAKRNDEWD